MNLMETSEFLSYVVTVIGLPFAIVVYVMEKRKERETEEEEIYQKLSDEYAGFLKLVLNSSDLQLRSSKQIELNGEQKERVMILFDLLISLFERAYILAYSSKMTKAQRRRWQSWEDYMIEWCSREDFRKQLPRLLEGEDEDFVNYITLLARKKDPSY